MYDVIVVGRLCKVDLETKSDLMFYLGLCSWGIARSSSTHMLCFVESKTEHVCSLP